MGRSRCRRRHRGGADRPTRRDLGGAGERDARRSPRWPSHCALRAFVGGQRRTPRSPRRDDLSPRHLRRKRRWTALCRRQHRSQPIEQHHRRRSRRAFPPARGAVMILLWGLPEDPPLAAAWRTLQAFGCPCAFVNQRLADRSGFESTFDGRGLRGRITMLNAEIPLEAVDAIYARPSNVSKLPHFKERDVSMTDAIRFEAAMLMLC